MTPPLIFKPNVPLTLNSDQFPLEQILKLNLQPGETFGIVLENDGTFQVWLSPETEKQRAELKAIAPDSELETQLRLSIEAVREPSNVRPIAAISKASVASEGLRPTGTDGPAPQPALAPRKPKTGPIPYNVAFREIVAFVTKELNEYGEQWSDQSRQGLVSTVLIAAARQKLLGVWER